MGQADEIVALVPQGGYALGAYQGAEAQGIIESGSPIDRVAGISFGAINAAILCGNAPSHGIQKNRTFRERVSSGRVYQEKFESDLPPGRLNEPSAAATTVTGADGASSSYDTAPLRNTLTHLEWKGRRSLEDRIQSLI
ncbi:patatin-like phospholipase family protein [uncultured Roseibium sp.]|uniref:patatin-like phospholipase family protein n=1 Tax=uncultured Roseibium sp. TaxID=1936171 RepID=UPI0032164286